MSAAQVDPHDKTRSRDLSKVARGEQAPRPAHEYGTVSKPPPPSQSSASPAQTNFNNVDHSDDDKDKKKGKHAPECEKFARYYRSLCSGEWIERWNAQRELSAFSGPI